MAKRKIQFKFISTSYFHTAYNFLLDHTVTSCLDKFANKLLFRFTEIAKMLRKSRIERDSIIIETFHSLTLNKC